MAPPCRLPGLPQGHRPHHRIPGPGWMGSARIHGTQRSWPTFLEKKKSSLARYGERHLEQFGRDRGLCRLGGAKEGSRGEALRLQVGLGYCCRGSLAKIRQELDTECGFRRERGWEGVGGGEWEVAPAALLRAPWEVCLLPAQGCWIDGSRPAALPEDAAHHRGTETWGAGSP